MMSFPLRDFVQMVSGNPFNYHFGLWPAALERYYGAEHALNSGNDSREDSEGYKGYKVIFRFFFVTANLSRTK